MQRKLWIGALAVTLSLAGISPPAGAHAKLTKAEPAPGSTVRVAPKVVRLLFKISPEELDVARSAVTVWDRNKHQVDDGKGGVDLNDMDRRTMVARLKAIGPGRYTVRWKAVSTPDGNVARGSFTFTVAPPTGMTPPPLSFVSPADGATVRNPVAVVFKAPANLSMMTMGSGMTGSMGAMPHLHIDVDRRVMMPTMKMLAGVGERQYRFSVGTLAPGRHVIRLYWADAKQHKPIGPVRQIAVTVDG